MLQNRSSSAESAHANTEASVSGHRLVSGGKSMRWVSKTEGILLSQEESGTWNIFARLQSFAAKTEFGMVLEYFCRIEIGLRIFLSKEAKGRKGVELEINCPSKRVKESKVKQVRRGVRSPVR